MKIFFPQAVASLRKVAADSSVMAVMLFSLEKIHLVKFACQAVAVASKTSNFLMLKSRSLVIHLC